MRLRGWLSARRDVEGLFAGSGGVRTGWRAAVFVALCVVQLGVVMALLAIVFSHTGDAALIVSGRYTPLFIAVNELALLLPVVGATLAMAFL